MCLSLDPLSINSASAQIPASRSEWRLKTVYSTCMLQGAATGRCSLQRHVDLQWLYNTPRTKSTTVCTVRLSQAFSEALFTQTRFTSFLARRGCASHSYSFTASHLEAVHRNHRLLYLAAEWLHWSDCGFFKDTTMVVPLAVKSNFPKLNHITFWCFPNL